MKYYLKLTRLPEDWVGVGDDYEVSDEFIETCFKNNMIPMEKIISMAENYVKFSKLENKDPKWLEEEK